MHIATAREFHANALAHMHSGAQQQPILTETATATVATVATATAKLWRKKNANESNNVNLFDIRQKCKRDQNNATKSNIF